MVRMFRRRIRKTETAWRKLCRFPFLLTQSDRGTRTASACSLLTGGAFFAEPQRGVCRLRTAGTCADAARAHKRDGHQGFHPSDFLPVSFRIVWRRLPTCDRSEKGTAEDFFFRRDGLRPLMYPHIRSIRYRTATQVVFFPQGAAQGELPEGREKVPWGMTVPHNTLARYDRQGLRR